MADPLGPTPLFLRAAAGERAAMDAAMTEVYEQLRAVAHGVARRAHDAALQPTALVHETYLRLCEQRSGGWCDRASFLAIAARVMRRVLVDHARRARRLRHGAAVLHEPLDETHIEARIAVEQSSLEVLVLEDLLQRLAEQLPEEALVAELLIFGGLTIQEAAAATGLAPRTVDRRWSFARAWLLQRATDAGGRV